MWKPRKTKGHNEGPQLVAVAVDADKSSQHALKWAADHLISKTDVFILLHVRRNAGTIVTPTGQQLSILDVNEDDADTFLEQIDLRTKELLLPFQCFCSRRVLRCKEVILDSNDIAKAIIDYVVRECVDKLVLGSSSRNTFTRAFKHADVPTSVSKIAPPFCSIYVISKGKLCSARPAPQPIKHPIDRQLSNKLEYPGHSFQSTKSEPTPDTHAEDFIRSSLERRARLTHSTKNDSGKAGGHLEYSYQSVSSCPSPPRTSIDQPSDHFLRGHAATGARPLRVASKCGEYPCNNEQMRNFENRSGGENYVYHDGQIRGFELNRSGGENYVYHDGQMRSFELNRSGGIYHDGQTRSFESNKSGSSRQYWSNESGSSINGLQSSGSTYSWSSQSQDDLEHDMRRGILEMKLNQKMDMHSSKEAFYTAKMARDLNSWSPEQEQRMEGFSEMKEEKPVRAVPWAANMEKTNRRADGNCLIDPEGLCSWSVEQEKRTERFSEMEEEEPIRTIPRATNMRETSTRADKNCLLDQERRNFLDCLSKDVRCRRYTLEEIEKATDYFSEELKIGEGGYGPVFKCTLDHTLVAIKILRCNATQGMKQFQQEIEVLSCIRHPNMVLLMGACPDYGCLVYEYMVNGSLEDCLFRKGNTPPLSWNLRFKIAAEIASGLLFLHQTKPEPLVHRDLKPGNILIDHNFVSKIADVGLARLIPPSAADAVTQYRMTAAAGTFCYIDPEYQKTGMLGMKSDIYALGIILLQLVTAKEPMGLTHNVEQALEDGTLEEMLDPTVPDWPMEETLKFVNLAMKCAELRHKDRPDLGTVILPELEHMRDFAELIQPGARFAPHV